MSIAVGDEPSSSRTKAAVPRRNRVPRRTSVVLSSKAAQILDELKKLTDAYSDSEVMRNALRVHYALLQHFAAGEALFLRNADGSGELTKIDLFVAS